MSARKHRTDDCRDAEGRAKQEARAENRSVYGIHEESLPRERSECFGYSSTELTPQSRKKTIFRGALLFTLVFIAGCTTPKPVLETEQYHQPDSSKVQQKSLNSLQMQALKLMNQQQYDSAIEYLQRAVKIDPRNALNWHYLAQNYWHKKEFSRCQDMIQRAIAYSQFDADLQRANRILLEQCSP